MIERIDTMCVVVSNVEKSSRWYEDKLGFTVTFRDDGYHILRIGNGSVPLTLEERETETGANPNYPIFFSYDIKGTYEELKNKVK